MFKKTTNYLKKTAKSVLSSGRLKTLALMLLVGGGIAMAQNSAGDYTAGTTALTTVTEEIAKYVPIVVKLCYAIAGVVAVVGAISVYIAMNNEEQDVKKKITTPSRLDRSKLLVTNMVDKMKNDKVALGVFAGEAYPQLPITSDYASAKMFIDALSTDMVTLQGTDIASAIELGCRSFTDKKDVGKAIILITDGENHEGGAEEAAKEANKKGINVYVLGVGTAEGGEIQTPNGPLTDENGQIVHTALNEEMCRKIAQAGHGIYLHLDQSNSAQEELRTQLSQLKQASSTTSYTARNEQFQAIAIIVILLLIIEACLNETKNSFFQRIKLFKR